MVRCSMINDMASISWDWEDMLGVTWGDQYFIRASAILIINTNRNRKLTEIDPDTECEIKIARELIAVKMLCGKANNDF